LVLSQRHSRVESGTQYSYTLDNLGRANKLSDDQATPVDWAKNVAYNPAGALSPLFG